MELKRVYQIKASNTFKPLLFVPLISKGSAKLEKAEILQMTVDHLKMLQATGGKGTELIFVLLLILAGETFAKAPFDLLG